MLYKETLNTISSNDYCVFCTPYIVLFAAFLTASVIIGGVFIYFYWHSEREDDVSKVTYNLCATHTLIN